MCIHVFCAHTCMCPKDTVSVHTGMYLLECALGVSAPSLPPSLQSPARSVSFLTSLSGAAARSSLIDFNNRSAD